MTSDLKRRTDVATVTRKPIRMVFGKTNYMTTKKPSIKTIPPKQATKQRQPPLSKQHQTPLNTKQSEDTKPHDTKQFPIVTSIMVPVVSGAISRRPGFGPDALSLLYPCSKNSTDEVHDALEGLCGPWGVANDVIDRTEEKFVSPHKIAFTYGEVLPCGVRALFDASHAAAAEARVLVDLGCGKARMALQAFLEYPNLDLVVGVEYSWSRFKFARAALQSLALANFAFMAVDFPDSTSVRLTLSQNTKSRALILHCQDLFDCKETAQADIVICETDIPKVRQPELTTLFSSQVKKGSRTHSLS